MFEMLDAQEILNKLQENFYIIYKDGQFILTNTKTHISYVLTQEKLTKLADQNLAIHDEDFINAGIVSKESNKSTWPFAPISKLFKDSVVIHNNEIEDLDSKEFWQEYLQECEGVLNNYELEKKSFCLDVINLPKARDINIDFYQGLKKRRTIREFFDQPMGIQELGDILFTTFGRFHENFGEKYMDINNTISWRRSSPSAGGLHSISAYLLIHNVQGLERGVYLYDDQNHSLKLLKKGFDQKQLIHVFLSQMFSQNAALHIITVANLKIVAQKYKHSRAYVFPYIESGHLIQTAWLCALSFQLKGWMAAAFCDDFFINEFNLQEYQIPISSFSIGYGCDQSLGPKIREELDQIKSDRQFISIMAMAKAEKEKVRIK
jgi:SagB-type dehydrogenase family enzyme